MFIDKKIGFVSLLMKFLFYLYFGKEYHGEKNRLKDKKDIYIAT